MKLFLIILLLPLFSFSQWKPTKNDIWLSAAQLVAGAADGMREEVLYHPSNLFEQHPNLNRQWWDSRISWKNKETAWVAFSDANHTFKVINQSADLLSVGIVLFEPHRKNLWKTAIRKMAIGYLARKAGFHLIYSLHFKNK